MQSHSPRPIEKVLSVFNFGVTIFLFSVFVGSKGGRSLVNKYEFQIMAEQTQQAQMLALLAAQAAAQNNLCNSMLFPQYNWPAPGPADLLFWSSLAQLSQGSDNQRQQSSSQQESFEEALRKMAVPNDISSSPSKSSFYSQFLIAVSVALILA